ncbi:ABC transporter ATP-binding protein [Pseudoflavonifractor sp. An85]|uniref:ABC transporter ATP-binding protein n=1 Tax=Pseudoflavonifractor sp. An85 TaxID=1965661 RepID=UPI000B392693|nr:ABC transporter ATP-binding protein [Pseudoflavonifractor sp. An85]OUN20428.1 thiamine ABC transporter permease [Pseudoflavonifractor sp. An85]
MDRSKFQRSHVSIFLSYYKPHLHLFLLDMACALGIALIDLAFPYVSRLSMQELLPQNLFGAFFAVMACLLLAYLLRAGMYYIVTYLGHMMGVLIEADIRRDLFGHMQDLSFSFYDKNRTGQLMSRATNDLFEITELAHHGPEDLFISVITLGGAFCLMLTIQWKLALIVFAVVPVFVLFTIFQRRRMMKASVQVKQNMAGINGQLESSISGMRTAKAFANEAQENHKFQQSNNQFKGAKRDYYKAMATYMAGLEFALPAMNVLTITAGGWFILLGEMTYIDLVTFALYISTFLTPVRKLAAFVEQFLNGMAGFKRFVELMRVEPAVQDASDALEMGTAKGDILVDDVSFSYEEGETVLDHVSIHIPQGETVAVVGPSGGGKSTLCQLIPRFYDVTGGRILMDGVDVRHITQQSLRQNIGIVQQDVFLFAGTIYDNIRYGKPDATQEEIVEAARRAEIYDDIMAMPDGFQTYVGERGVMLSGGQKQRVSIARIFLKNPPVLILDEATSALDSVTEARIQSAFDELAKGRTTLIIAHRLSTIRNAHRIIVVDDNRIVEEGTHEDLLQSGGEYAQLYNAQKSVRV